MKNVKNILTIGLLLSAAPVAFGCAACEERERQAAMNDGMQMSAPMQRNMDSGMRGDMHMNVKRPMSSGMHSGSDMHMNMNRDSGMKSGSDMHMKMDRDSGSMKMEMNNKPMSSGMHGKREMPGMKSGQSSLHGMSAAGMRNNAQADVDNVKEDATKGADAVNSNAAYDNDTRFGKGAKSASAGDTFGY